MAGQTQVLFTGVPAVIAQVRSGQLKALAVSGKARVDALPDVPTVNEALGLKDYELIAYFAVFAPAGTPPDIVAKLNKAVNEAANSKEIQDRFAGIGFAVEPGTPADLAKRSVAETAKWAKAIKDAKIEPQ